MTFLRWQWCLSSLVADFNSRVIGQTQPGPSSVLTKMFMGFVSVAFMEAATEFFLFCLLQSHGPNENRSNGIVDGVEEKGGLEQASFIIEVNGSRYGTTVVPIISASVYYSMLYKA
ncbi:hypothetical protein CEXT_96121 [Caerostris extrusa]|uniref:Uncharacterized protein n=1 Tax=Caerostris extrusa TaxID=172846 RepID=A0AAV4W3P6_CAEEX|nr:hypothetical protein CEXT_96121 [Caerostris extrusa]